MANYTTIYNFYDANLNRTGYSSSVSDDTFSTDSIGSTTNSESISPSFENVWINTWIKSKDYKPQRSGWMLDGKSGKVEINNVTHFGGKITIESLGEIKASDLTNDLGWTNDATVNSLISSMGNLAYENLVGSALLDSTVISGGYIRSSLITATNIITGILTGITVRTGSSGKRVTMTNDVLQIYDSSNTYERIRLDSGKILLNTGSSALAESTSAQIYKDLNGLHLVDYTEGGGGYIILGSDGSTETVTLSGNVITGGTSWDIGTSSNPFGDLYLTGSVYFDDTAFSGVNGTSISPSSVTSSGTVRPSSNGDVNCGSSSYRWGIVYANYIYIYGSGSSSMQLGGDGTTMTVNKNFAPSSSNSKYCGTSSNYWARVYSDAYFTKNTTLQTFDIYDDLQILRDLQFDRAGKLMTDNLPSEIASGGFVNFGGMVSFNLCASRRIVECVDDLRSQMAALREELGLEKKKD